MNTRFILIFLFFSASLSSQTWNRIDSKIKEGLHDIEIINDKDLISYSYGTGNIYKTNDAGETWDIVSGLDSVYYEQIHFTDDANGWLVGSPNKVFKTEDGGLSWKAVDIQSENESALIYGMAFKDKNIGHIVFLGQSGSMIYETNDGGGKWDLVNTIKAGLLNIEWIGNSLYGTGYDIIIRDVEKPNNYKVVYRDTTRQAGQMRDIDMGTDDKLIAVSFNGNVVEQEGEQWKVRQLSKNRLRNVLYIGEGNWIASGDSNEEKGNLFLSSDNGLTWIKSKEVYPDIHRIVRGKGVLWMVGKEGLIMKKKI